VSSASAEAAIRSASALAFPASCDARVQLAVASAAWLVVLGAAHPLTSLSVAVCAGASLFGVAGSLHRLRRPLAAGAFTALLAVVLRVVLTPGQPVLTLVLFGHALPVTDAGLHAAGTLGARVLGALAVGGWLSAVSSPEELLVALGWYRVPPALLEILALAARYTSVLRDAMDTGQSAQTLRLGYAGLRTSLRSAGVLAGFVVGRAFDQALVTGQAMQLRGSGALLLGVVPERRSRGDRRLVALAAAALCASVLVPRRWPW
jgi:energy-coupling factor transporter transmembrane protein EcfT